MIERGKGKKKPGMVREAVVAYVPERVTRWIPAAEFKADCLKLIEDVRQGRGEVVVTRYGRPVARLVPFEDAPPSLIGHMAGTVVHYGDLVSPVDEVWDADA